MNIFRRKGGSVRDRRIVAILTDTHGGKQVGLLNPDTVLIKADERGEICEWKPQQTTVHNWLWSVYMDSIQGLTDYAGDDEIIVIHNGDITNGDRYNSNIPDTTLEDQRVIAVDNMLPLVELPNVKQAWLMTGTEVHVPECAEARVAHTLRKTTGKNVNCAHHALFDMGADEIEVAHHGPFPGSRDWLRANVAFLHLKDRIYRDRRIGKVPARVYVYGHYHRLVYASVKDRWEGAVCENDLVVVPALSGLDSFARKVAKSPPVIEAGLVCLEFIDGHLSEITDFVKEEDLRTRITL